MKKAVFVLFSCLDRFFTRLSGKQNICLILASMVFAAEGGSVRGQSADLCRMISYEDVPYIICGLDLSRVQLTLERNTIPGPARAVYSGIVASRSRVSASAPVIIMNAGMYDVQLHPIGLYIEKGEIIKKISKAGGKGNFHMLPNGVFYISGMTAGITETNRYVKLNLKPDYATQSGPMLVIDNKIHAQFKADSLSLKIRNGVGIAENGKIWFAISRQTVSFHAFARLFRDYLNCRDALYLDGTISALYSRETGITGGLFPVGPLIIVTEKNQTDL